MLYVKNLPLWERLLRIGAGALILVYAYMNIDGVIGWFTMAAGVGTAVTGIFGFCPACAMVGRRLDKQLPKIQK